MPEAKRLFVQPTWSQIVVAVLIGALGFAVMVQLDQDDADDYTNVRGTQLVELLKSLDAANERLGTQIDDLSTTRNDLLNSTRLSEQAAEQARRRAGELSILAGSVGASGPGVVVTITAPGSAIDAALLLDAVQELRDAGAEAIVINGNARVVAQTYFLDDNGAIRVGGREVKAPYIIEAIGDPSTMATAVGIRGGLVDRVNGLGGLATIKEVEALTITALADVKPPEYAQPSS